MHESCRAPQRTRCATDSKRSNGVATCNKATLYGGGFHKKRLTYHEWNPGSSTSGRDNALSDIGITFHLLLPTSDVEIGEDGNVMDTCEDDDHKYYDPDYCVHLKLIAKTKVNQRMLPVLLWPFADGGSDPVVTPSVTDSGSNGTVSTVRIADSALGINDCWELSRASLATGMVAASGCQ